MFPSKTMCFSKSLTWHLFHIVQSKNHNSFLMLSFYIPQVVCRKQATFSSIQEAENEMKNTTFHHLITDICPPKSFLCFEAHWVLERRRDTCTSINLHQIYLRVSLVKRTIDKLNSLMNRNPALARTYHTTGETGFPD